MTENDAMHIIHPDDTSEHIHKSLLSFAIIKHGLCKLCTVVHSSIAFCFYCLLFFSFYLQQGIFFSPVTILGIFEHIFYYMKE